MLFRHLARSAVALAMLPLLLTAARAEEWDPRSTPEHACGTGEPPRGHAPREIASAGGALEITLTVRQEGERLCYVESGNAEAPVLRLKPGDRLTIHLANEIADAGPLQLFQSKPKLDEANKPVEAERGFYPVIAGARHLPTGRTNLHLHGLPVPPVAPADEVLKGCADPATGDASCGRRSITYHYDLPRNLPAGLYWYHPHVHGETESQIALGLSGAIIVEGPEDAARRAAGIAERVLIVRQVDEPDEEKPAVAPDETMAHAHGAPLAAAKRPARIDTAQEVQCGSSEDAGLLTLNGALVDRLPKDDSALALLQIPAGAKQLWRLVNTSGDAYLDLVLLDQQGKPVPIEILARDGVRSVDDRGRRLRPETTSSAQLVPPAGRIEFLVSAPPPGARHYLVSRAVDTGCAGDPVPERKLALVTQGGAAPAASAMPAAAAATGLSLYDGLLGKKVDRRRTIAFSEYPRPGTRDETDFYITELKPGATLHPFTMDGPPELVTRAGSVEEWVIENWSHELHAFHMHQVHFRVLSVNGKKLAAPPLLDTVNVPFATPDIDDPKAKLTPGRVRIKLYFPPELAGDIPFHCHLLDHEDNGMMAVIRVLPKASAGRPVASRATHAH
jgi:FtsP/CotA-like multicopper oxidase with cupredoxin domain